jgi:hypothetical protein
MKTMIENSWAFGSLVLQDTGFFNVFGWHHGTKNNSELETPYFNCVFALPTSSGDE